VPRAESLPGNLLFVVGCDRQTGNRWYRILHGDGKVVLKGWSSSSELEQSAGGNVGSNAFAIRIAFSGFGSNSRFDYSLSRHFNFSRYCYFNAHSQLGLRRE
jgi:hypothetical protein